MSESDKPQKARERHECPFCGKHVSTFSNLNRHVRSKHEMEQPASSKKSSECQYEDCDYHYFALNQYREHLFQKHEIAYATQFIEFSTKEAFISWLESTEQYSSTRFTVGVSRPMKEGCSKVYYYCSRSGRYRSRSTGVRKIKAQGSCKIGTRCPSGFTLTTMEDKTPKYTVEYYPTHLGHDKLLGHTQIPRSVRRQIAEQLSQGLSERSILETYRSSMMHSDDLSRVHLLTLKDINNIRTSLGLPHSLPLTRSSLAPQNPTINNIELWIKTQEDEAETSPVILYKPRGLDHPTLQGEDFVLVLMTPFQRRMTANYIHDGVCVDSVASNSLSLTTLMCVDDYEEGYPAAFCISSTVSQGIVNAFLESVKESIGTITATYLMSDDVPLYYNAWCQVMGEVHNTRLSVWHVLSTWQKYLECIEDTTKRDFIYNSLLECMRIRDVSKFETVLSGLIEELSVSKDEDVSNFKDYFEENYCSRVEAWAFCYREGANAESELRVDSLHKSLDNILHKSEHNVVKLVDTVMAYVNVRLFERIVNMHKSKTLPDATSAKGLKVSRTELHVENSIGHEDEMCDELVGQEVVIDLHQLESAEVVVEEHLDIVEEQTRRVNQEGLFEALNECIVLFNNIHEQQLGISDEQCFAMHEHLHGFKQLLSDVTQQSTENAEFQFVDMGRGSKCKVESVEKEKLRVMLNDHNYFN